MQYPFWLRFTHCKHSGLLFQAWHFDNALRTVLNLVHMSLMSGFLSVYIHGYSVKWNTPASSSLAEKWLKYEVALCHSWQCVREVSLKRPSADLTHCCSRGCHLAVLIKGCLMAWSRHDRLIKILSWNFVFCQRKSTLILVGSADLTGTSAR